MKDGVDGPAASMHRKTMSLEIVYTPGRQDPARGVFEGGVPEPDFLDELAVDATPDQAYQEDADDIEPTGKTQIHIRGSRRSYVELARYLLALTEISTVDPDYHDHFDDLADSRGNPSVHLIVHAPPP